jgi:hypothetical protein
MTSRSGISNSRRHHHAFLFYFFNKQKSGQTALVLFVSLALERRERRERRSNDCVEEEEAGVHDPDLERHGSHCFGRGKPKTDVGRTLICSYSQRFPIPIGSPQVSLRLVPDGAPAPVGDSARCRCRFSPSNLQSGVGEAAILFFSSFLSIPRSSSSRKLDYFKWQTKVLQRRLKSIIH